MGLVNKFTELRMKDPVEGTLTVVGISAPDPTATSANYRLDGVVSAEGLPPTAVVHHGMASVAKWPSGGDTLPVTVDRAKPERLTIHWERLASGHQQNRTAAQALAEQMRSGATSPAGGSAAAVTAQAGWSPAAPGSPSATPPVVSAADVLARGTPGLAAVLAVFPSAETANKPELSDAQRILAAEAARRESIFQQSVDAEKNRGDALARRFEEALRQAHTEPVTKPTDQPVPIRPSAASENPSSAPRTESRRPCSPPPNIRRAEPMNRA